MNKDYIKRIRASAIKGERASLRRAATSVAEIRRRPDVFATVLIRDINELATNLRRVKRDKVGQHFEPSQRAAMVTAAGKLAALLCDVPDMVDPSATVARVVPVHKCLGVSK